MAILKPMISNAIAGLKNPPPKPMAIWKYELQKAREDEFGAQKTKAA